MADIRSSTWSTNATNNNAAPPDGWPEGQSPSSVNNCAREMMAAIKRAWNDDHPVNETAGSNSAYTLVTSASSTAYATGDMYVFRANHASVGTSTLNVNGIGVKSIKDASDRHLSAGTIKANQVVQVAYEPVSDVWQIMNLSSSNAEDITYTPSGTSATATTVQAKLREFVSVKDFGAVGDGVTDDTAAFYAWAAALTDHSVGTIPPGQYKIDTTSEPIGFAASNLTINAHGALITQYGTNAVAFDLNKNATPTESAMENNVRWFGGRFQNSTSGESGNTNIGIRARGITRGCIAHVFGQGHGSAFIEQEVRDAFYIYDCHGFQNDKHIWFGEYQTTTSNPQALTIKECGFSTHYTAGIAVDSSISDLSISNCYFTSDDSIVIETGSGASYGSYNNQNINIFHNSFEQGTTGNFYIRVVNTNSRNLRNLNIENNNFQESSTKCIKLESVNGCVIEGNRFVSTEDGHVDIDSASKNITFGYNEYFSYTSYSQGLSFACPRTEIYFSSDTRFRDVIQLTGWNYSGISTGTGTLDMSSLIGSYWLGDPKVKFCPPKAYCMRVIIEDSGTGADLGFRIAKDASENTNYSANALLDNATAGQKQVFEFWVNADDSGDLYYSATASGTDTLKVRLLLVGLQH